MINDVSFEGQENNAGELITSKKRVKDMNSIHLKYVDDLTLAEAIKMNTQITSVPLQDRPQPDPYRARTGHKLIEEQSQVLNKLNEVKNYADTNNMKINVPKTKLMVFNPCHSKDFLPLFEVESRPVELVEQTKLLGVIVSSNLSWAANTEYIIKRCNKKIWVLRRLKKLGADNVDLLEVYFKQIRSILEFAVPVWNSSLTGEDTAKLERVQKTVLHIILGHKYNSYSSALKLTGLQKLSERRRKICLSFAKKSVKHEKFSKWFKLNTKQTGTRQNQTKYCETARRTERFENSPLSYLTNLLNKQYSK